MKLKLVYSLAAAAVMSAAAFAQAGSSSALPSAPGAASDPVATNPGGSKIGAINVEAAIFDCNEGQRDFGALEKKLAPKQTQLKAQNDEIEALKKKLAATTTTEPDKADLQRQIDIKQKALERDVQDAQEDARGQQNEIAQRILGKMAPLIVKYATENGYGLIIDTSTSNQWPNGPVLWHGATLDITKPVIEAYNAQSAVPTPAPEKPAAGGARPAGTNHPAGPASKPASTTPAK